MAVIYLLKQPRRPLLEDTKIHISHDLWLSWLSADNERLSGMVIKQEAAAFNSTITQPRFRATGRRDHMNTDKKNKHWKE